MIEWELGEQCKGDYGMRVGLEEKCRGNDKMRARESNARGMIKWELGKQCKGDYEMREGKAMQGERWNASGKRQCKGNDKMIVGSGESMQRER